MDNKHYFQSLKLAMQVYSSEEKAASSRRYFPAGIECLGITAVDIKRVVKDFQTKHIELDSEQSLALSEYILANAKYSEEKLVAFALLNKFVKKYYPDELLDRFEYWLEHYADNWSLVDDLCIKTIYQFLLSRPHLITKTEHWSRSSVSWCRRASCVVWVKFIQRKIAKTTYHLDKSLVFSQCDILLADDDVFVQKGVGWLLKVTSQYHCDDVVEYITSHYQDMTRLTLRYAIEKMPEDIRLRLLSLTVE